MLTRKPMIGETVLYASTNGAQRYIITGFVDDSSGNIAKMKPEGGGAETLIIWRFHDGLNKLLDIEQAAEVMP